ncbi:UbiA-like protein EboC [Fibrella sp. HMF5335]|uniref:UbiA-like protein EboC n=1 Tax=Fibrella rubiginis TaxID=2817060 RepID=A0A939K2C2_9BACT|nr:UbiA-like protein EboC [Fibrella rubiginis]MBO0936159.1 UbiA-like protein EboC [Fibrella rubiginis]
MKSYLQLMRPANLLTAAADVLAGAALAPLAGLASPFGTGQPVWLLVLSTIGLYGGGVVLNDVFDAELDAVERPERPIPGGRVSLGQASALGVGLLALGVALAFFYGQTSGWLALLVAGLAVFYDRFGKHQSLFGPVNMGLCRGVNLLLGVSAAGADAVGQLWWLGIVPVIYIAAITMISRDEVHGGKQRTLYFAGFLYLLVIACQLWMASRAQTLLITLGFVFLHLVLIGRPLLTAVQNPIGPNIGKAVKAGVLSLIVMDAAWVSVSGNWPLALGVLLLLPLSIPVAKYFAVT